ADKQSAALAYLLSSGQRIECAGDVGGGAGGSCHVDGPQHRSSRFVACVEGSGGNGNGIQFVDRFLQFNGEGKRSPFERDPLLMCFVPDVGDHDDGITRFVGRKGEGTVDVGGGAVVGTHDHDVRSGHGTTPVGDCSRDDGLRDDRQPEGEKGNRGNGSHNFLAFTR